MAQPDFSAKIKNSFFNAFRRASEFSRCSSQTLSKYFKQASGEARVLYDGALHASAASPDECLKIRRDALGLCTETGLSLAEAVEFEIAAIVAAAQAGEKITHHGEPLIAADWQRIAAETGESLIASPVAALHCAHDLYYDLDHAGRAYEAAQKRQRYII